MFQLNELVLAKLGKSVPWPAKIIHDLKDNKYQVQFYGSFQSAVIHSVRIFKYDPAAEKALIPDSLIKYNHNLRKAVKEIRIESSQRTLKTQMNVLEQSISRCINKFTSNNFLLLDMSKLNQCEYEHRELDYKSKCEMQNNDFKAELQLCKDLKQQINDLKIKTYPSNKPNIFQNRVKLEEKLTFKTSQLVLAKKDGARLYCPAKIVSSKDYNFTVHCYINQETVTLRGDQIQKFNRKLMRTLFKKVNIKQLDTAITCITLDKELILKEKEKELLYTLEAKIRRHKNRSMKDLNKKKCQIRNKFNGFISKATSHRLLDQLDVKIKHLINIQNKSLKNEAQHKIEVCQEENENESDIDLRIIEPPVPDWCAKESLEQLIEEQFKTKVDNAAIFKDCRPETLNLKEYFPKQINNHFFN